MLFEKFTALAALKVADTVSRAIAKDFSQFEVVLLSKKLFPFYPRVGYYHPAYGKRETFLAS